MTSQFSWLCRARRVKQSSKIPRTLLQWKAKTKDLKWVPGYLISLAVLYEGHIWETPLGGMHSSVIVLTLQCSNSSGNVIYRKLLLRGLDDSTIVLRPIYGNKWKLPYFATPHFLNFAEPVPYKVQARCRSKRHGHFTCGSCGKWKSCEYIIATHLFVIYDFRIWKLPCINEWNT